MSDAPILENLTALPKAGRDKFYRWCDYIELRCITHMDKRFSRDGLSEAIGESTDTEMSSFDDSDSTVEADGVEEQDVPEADIDECYAAQYFRQLRWRQMVFENSWPFELDEHALEIQLKKTLSFQHTLYLQLLISSSLSYCPKVRWLDLTRCFERISLEVFRRLMPDGSEVHAFGSAESTRYRGHLYDRLLQLTRDVRGHLVLKKKDFAKNDVGDCGLDIVAWHGLGDKRKGIPIAFAQCGCTVDGWPNKMLEASPAHLAAHLHTMHDWATYYFMPLDLSDGSDGEMSWQQLSDFSKTIVIDRLRLIRLTGDDSCIVEADFAAMKLVVTEATEIRAT